MSFHIMYVNIILFTLMPDALNMAQVLSTTSHAIIITSAGILYMKILDNINVEE